MIISLDRARELFPNKTDEEIRDELLAIETMIRNNTNNKFQDIRVRYEGTCKHKDNKIYGPFKDKLFRVGDRVQVSDSVLNEGLYDIVDITDEYIELDAELEEIEAQTMVTKIVYPADIAKGVIELIEYDKKMEDKAGFKRETISRYTVEYFDLGSKENVEGYPHSLMAFIRKYRKLRW